MRHILGVSLCARSVQTSTYLEYGSNRNKIETGSNFLGEAGPLFVELDKQDGVQDQSNTEPRYIEENAAYERVIPSTAGYQEPSVDLHGHACSL